MNEKNSKKSKFPHSSHKLLYFSTYFESQQAFYLIQTDGRELLIGPCNPEFTIKWTGEHRDRIACHYYCQQKKALYLGCGNGNVYHLDMTPLVDEGVKLIGSTSNDPVVAMFVGQGQLVAVHRSGTLAQYSQGQTVKQVKLPFSIVSAVSNKSIQKPSDTALTFLRPGGKFPYIFSCSSVLSMFEQPDQLAALFTQYQSSMDYQPDQLLPTQHITHLALSNTDRVLALSTKQHIYICMLKKTGPGKNHIKYQPDIKFVTNGMANDMDIVGTRIIYISDKFVGNYDFEAREKVSTGLNFEGTDVYNMVRWGNVGQSFLFGCHDAKKVKLYSYAYSAKNKK